MPASFTVHLNKDGSRSVVAPDRYETTGSFTVNIVNHGGASHVHLHLDDDLSRVARVDAVNHYVDADSTRAVHVAVADDAPRPSGGRLEISTGYGQHTASVGVDVADPTDEPVDVDESLGRPAQEPPEEDPDVTTGHLVGVGGVAAVLGLAAILVSDAAAVVVGSLAVLVVAGLALYVLQSS